MITKRCVGALSFLLTLSTSCCALAQAPSSSSPAQNFSPASQAASASSQVQPGTAPGASNSSAYGESAPAYDNNDLLLSAPLTETPIIQEPGPVQPPTLPTRPPLDPSSLPGSVLPSPSQGKPTLVWRAKVHRLFADQSPPVVRTSLGSLRVVFQNLLKACGDAGFEVKGENAESGELWVRRAYNDEVAVRCNLYFAVTEQPVGRVIVKVGSDKNSAAELKAANAILDTFMRGESERNSD